MPRCRVRPLAARPRVSAATGLRAVCPTAALASVPPPGLTAALRGPDRCVQLPVRRAPGRDGGSLTLQPQGRASATHLLDIC